MSKVMAVGLCACLALHSSFELNTIQDTISSLTEIASSIGNTNDSVTICVAGDNLIHSRIIKSGDTGIGYDYNYMYENISDYINSFDIAVLNQETPLIFDPAEYSSYPRFGSPSEVGVAAINAGFDIFTQATNHAFDKGHQGLCDSYETWNAYDKVCIGIHPYNEDSSVYICEVNNIKIAMLNYTYGLNGLEPKEEWSYMVDTLYDKDKIIRDLNYAKMNSDFTIVFPHWGTEYVLSPTDEQREWAEFFVEYGADLIIGTHPHVIEPLEYIKSADGTMVPVYYSLGNFISNQDEIPRMLGMVAEVTLVKDKDGGHIEASAIPVVTHISCYSEYFEVYKLEDYTEELAAEHRMRRVRGNNMNVDYLWSLWNEVMGYEEK